MLKKSFAAILLLTSTYTGVVSADVVKVPSDQPAVTVDVPASWKPEKIENGIVIESPDQVATLYMEVTAAKASDALLEENMAYLQKEHNVTADVTSTQLKAVKIGGLDWTRISLDGKSKDFGPAEIGFLLLGLPGDKALTVTYWINKKDKEKQERAVDVILDSIKPLK